jgi:predicted AAA+ superfamily ATPase
MKRALETAILKDLEKKIVLLSGPRQVGKTTLSKQCSANFEYLNYDRIEDRRKINALTWDRTADLLILDELHKMKNWKAWLKGLADGERTQKILVTGSARLETFKKVGDSLAGRYFSHSLMPLDLKELHAVEPSKSEAQSAARFEQLWNLSGFPEPYFSESITAYKRWRKTHLDVMIRQDLPERESVKRVSDIETLMLLLIDRVGSPLSHNSLREDLQTDDKSIKRWVLWLEQSYALFRVTPFSRKLTHTLKKAPKIYLFDYPRVEDPGARLENLVALSLFKETLRANEIEGENYSLHYLQHKSHKEIDFLIARDQRPVALIEVKTSDSEISPNFSVFIEPLRKQNPKIRQIQLVKNLKRRFSTPNGIEVEPLIPWLEALDFGKLFS